MRVVICGGGMIGACTAYFLSRRGIDVLVVERTKVAAAAFGPGQCPLYPDEQASPNANRSEKCGHQATSPGLA